MSDILELKIDNLGASADGIAYHNQKKYFIAYALPNELVSAEFTTNKKKPHHLKLLEVKEATPDRIEAFCPKFTKCGGCAIQHLNSTAYKVWKSNILAQALKNQAIAVKLNEIKMVGLGKRTRISISYENFKGKVEFGFFQKFSKYITDIDFCPLLVAELNDLLLPLRELLVQITRPRDSGHFMITKTATGIDLAFCPRKKDNLELINQFLIDFAHKYNIARITRAGKELIIERIKPQVTFAGQHVDFPSGAFLQPSLEGAGMLLAEIIKIITNYKLKPKKILDLCCGLGTFSLPLTKYAFVKAIDVHGPSINALKKHEDKALAVEERNLFTNPLVKDEILAFDLVIINPPRCGAEKQIKNIAESHIKNLIYISCDITSFANAAKILLEHGYKLLETTPIDQFPYTNHLEVVGYFSCEKK